MRLIPVITYVIGASHINKLELNSGPRPWVRPSQNISSLIEKETQPWINLTAGNMACNFWGVVDSLSNIQSVKLNQEMQNEPKDRAKVL